MIDAQKLNDGNVMIFVGHERTPRDQQENSLLVCSEHDARRLLGAMSVVLDLSLSKVARKQISMSAVDSAAGGR